MRPIPPKMREQMAADPYYKKCCITPSPQTLGCEGRIEWHHSMINAGRSIQEVWAILPACSYHHSLANRPDIQKLFHRAALKRATPEDLAKYPRKDWKQIKKFLGI